MRRNQMTNNNELQELDLLIAKAEKLAKLTANNHTFKELLRDLDDEALRAGMLTMSSNEELRNSGLRIVQGVAFLKQHLQTTQQVGQMAEQQKKELIAEEAELNQGYEG